MANYSYLLATNTKKPCDASSPAALQLRTGEHMIPLLWFGCFRTLDVNKHQIQCLDETGSPAVYEAMTLYCKRSTVIEQFDEFADRLIASHAMGIPAEQHIETLISDLKCVDCYAFQLDCSELQFVISPQEFDMWLSRGLEFSEKVSCGAWANLLVMDEEKKEALAEFFECSQIYPHRRENVYDEDEGEDDEDEEEENATARSRRVMTRVARPKVKRKTSIWECANWEHSLVGISAEESIM
ncbi:MAG TPA: hypothetical protein V6C81_17600 [Planktothrix sp.]|jgi:hypothetical protein